MAIQISELTQISNLLVTMNSSVNFIIYCIFGEKFKRLFCHLFCSRCGATEKDNFQLLHRYTTANDRRRRFADRRLSNSKVSLVANRRFGICTGWGRVWSRGEIKVLIVMAPEHAGTGNC